MGRVTLTVAMLVCVQMVNLPHGYAITEKDAVRQALEVCHVSLSSSSTRTAKNDCVIQHWLKAHPNSLYESAEDGSVGLQFWLGRAYERGDLGVSQDYTQSMRWYRMAAERGLSAAQKKMGDFFFMGKGVAVNYREAVPWYRLAAEQGDGASHLALGILYEFGKGVPQDFVKAHMWYNLAVASGDTNLDESREDIETFRETLAARMTADQIAEAQKMAREWRPKKVKNHAPLWMEEALR
jgi:TPR repeat protein